MNRAAVLPFTLLKGGRKPARGRRSTRYAVDLAEKIDRLRVTNPNTVGAIEALVDAYLRPGSFWGGGRSR